MLELPRRTLRKMLMHLAVGQYLPAPEAAASLESKVGPLCIYGGAFVPFQTTTLDITLYSSTYKTTLLGLFSITSYMEDIFFLKHLPCKLKRDILLVVRSGCQVGNFWQFSDATSSALE